MTGDHLTPPHHGDFKAQGPSPPRQPSGISPPRQETACAIAIAMPTNTVNSPKHHSPLIHHIEHIVAKQHGGLDDFSNLALACHRCNDQKGPNLLESTPSPAKSFRSFIHDTNRGSTILG